MAATGGDVCSVLTMRLYKVAHLPVARIQEGSGLAEVSHSGLGWRFIGECDFAELGVRDQITGKHAMGMAGWHSNTFNVCGHSSGVQPVNCVEYGRAADASREGKSQAVGVVEPQDSNFLFVRPCGVKD